MRVAGCATPMLLLLGGVAAARSRAGFALRAAPACFVSRSFSVRMQGLATGSRAARKPASGVERGTPRKRSKKGAAEDEAEGTSEPPPTASKHTSLFVVESPSKAKTLGQYLGDSFRVLATKGHVRVLPPRKNSVVPDDEFAMTFEVPEKQREHLRFIVHAAQEAQTVYLAMDPDREGEAIAWHLLQELKAAGLPLAPSARASLGEGGECDIAREPAVVALPAPKRAPRARRKAAAAPGADEPASAAEAALAEAVPGGEANGALGVWRVSFNSVSREAVLEALASPRPIDLNLVAAQQARQALDYLVGFTLSPVLWRRMPAARSAGRVQSAALRLIAEREAQIERFVPLHFWDVTVHLARAGDAPAPALPGAGDTDVPANGGKGKRGTGGRRAAEAEEGGGGDEGAGARAAGRSGDAGFAARLCDVSGRRLGKHALRSEDDAIALRNLAQTAEWQVASARASRMRRAPKPPFNTASLQQEASSRLRMSVSHAMSVAQQLYEGVSLGSGEQVGLITYMRTDAFNISAQALADVRSVVAAEYGAGALPPAARTHASKSKNSQEAHEAVRPVEMGRLPWSAELRAALTPEQGRLYELIWRRTAASQMADAQYDATTVLLDGLLPGADAGELRRADAEAQREEDAEAAEREGADSDEPADGEARTAADGGAADGGGAVDGERVDIGQLIEQGGVRSVRARASGRVLVDAGFLSAYPPPASSLARWGGQLEDGGGANGGKGARAAASAAATAGPGGEEGEAEDGGADSAPDGSSADDGTILPPLSAGDALALLGAHAHAHVTKPPGRYSEASLVRKLEELGIGRPSTYAPTMRVLATRGYVGLGGRTLVPTLTGRFLNAFLCAHFPRYIEDSFTASVEAELDEISAGRLRRTKLLGDFWPPLAQLAEDVSSRPATDAWAALDVELGYLAFQPDAAALGEGALGAGGEAGADGKGGAAMEALLPRECPECATGRLTVKHSRFGPFIGCSAHPACTYAKPFPQSALQQEEGEGLNPLCFPRVLGADADGCELSVRLGPYGAYVQKEHPVQAAPPDDKALESQALAKLPVPELKQQLRESGAVQSGRKAELLERLRALRGLPPPPEPAAEAERRRLPLSLSARNVSLEEASRLFRLPRALGEHPTFGGPMTAKLGMKAGYIEHNSSYYWLEEPALAFSVTADEAAALVSERRAAREASPAAQRRASRMGSGSPRLRKLAVATRAKSPAKGGKRATAPAAAARGRTSARAPVVDEGGG